MMFLNWECPAMASFRLSFDRSAAARGEPMQCVDSGAL
jgi:hypothetical protein